MKIEKKPATLLYPVPVVLVTCAGSQGPPNIITIAWTGIVCSEPPMISISVRPSRHSHKLISETGEFVVNVPTSEILAATDYCGHVSGRDVDKFASTGLTPEPATKVRAPLIKECPLNLECVVRQTITLGVHDMFIAEIVMVHQEQEVLDSKGILDVSRAHPITYSGAGHYWATNDCLATYGFARKMF